MRNKMEQKSDMVVSPVLNCLGPFAMIVQRVDYIMQVRNALTDHEGAPKDYAALVYV